MKSLFRSTALLVLLSLALIGCSTHKLNQNIPEIEFRYAHIFDSICWSGKYPKGSGIWIKELYQTMPTFHKIWKSEGEPLLKEATKMFNKGFKKKEMIGSLFLCGNFISIGAPLLIKAGIHLNSPMKNKPISMKLFTAVVFHELLHTYIEENFLKEVSNSKIALKYLHTGENRTVRSHLHLMSIMKNVYLNLGETDLLDRVIKFESSFSPSYKKSWEIVKKDFGLLLLELKDRDNK